MTGRGAARPGVGAGRGNHLGARNHARIALHAGRSSGLWWHPAGRRTTALHLHLLLHQLLLLHLLLLLLHLLLLHLLLLAHHHGLLLLLLLLLLRTTRGVLTRAHVAGRILTAVICHRRAIVQGQVRLAVTAW